MARVRGANFGSVYTIYCRGVGVVRSHSQDLGGNGWDAQLTATNF